MAVTLSTAAYGCRPNFSSASCSTGGAVARAVVVGPAGVVVGVLAVAPATVVGAEPPTTDLSVVVEAAPLASVAAVTADESDDGPLVPSSSPLHATSPSTNAASANDRMVP